MQNPTVFTHEWVNYNFAFILYIGIFQNFYTLSRIFGPWNVPGNLLKLENLTDYHFELSYMKGGSVPPCCNLMIAMKTSGNFMKIKFSSAKVMYNISWTTWLLCDLSILKLLKKKKKKRKTCLLINNMICLIVMSHVCKWVCMCACECI